MTSRLRLSPFCKTFLQKIQKTLIEQCQVTKPFRHRILIACSGGSDSLALLHVMSLLFGPKNIDAVYVNHKIRPESDNEGLTLQQKYVHLAAHWFVEEVKKSCLENPSEDSLREARFSALFSLAEKNHYDFIALGHTQDDQIETILFRFIRGSGVAGLRGIPFKRQLYIRPLLNVSKQDCQNFLSELGITEWVEDSTNQQNNYARNRIRNELIPLCEKIHHGFSHGIITTHTIVEEENAFLDQLAYQWFEQYQTHHGIKREGFSKLSVALQRRVLLFLFRRFFEDESISFIHIEEIRLSLLKKNKNRRAEKKFSFLKTGIFTVDEKEIRWIKKNSAHIQKPEHWELHISHTGKYEYPFGYIEVHKRNPSALNFSKTKKNSLVAYFDLESIDFPLKVRCRKAGDQMLVFGKASMTKTIKNIFIDEHVDKKQRNKVPIFLSMNKILWAAGVIRSNHALVHESVHEILEIRVFPFKESLINSEIPRYKDVSPKINYVE